MKILDCLSSVANVGTKLVDLWSKGTDAMDRIIHKKEYEAEKKQAVVYRVMLIAACTVLGLLLLPYKFVIKKENGYIYIKSTLLTLTNETDEEKADRLAKERGSRVLDDLPADSEGDGFEISGAVEDDPAIEIVSSDKSADEE